jgi:lysyl-tRNA synthetase class 2
MANIENLKKRATIIAQIRQFFAERDVLEVETPILGSSTATDPHIASFMLPFNANESRYLQTSPEFPMKRLLAAGSGSIYQIAKAFRMGEQGRLHHPEFTMLEWYRVGFDHHALMREVDELLQMILKTVSAEYVTYAQIFERHLGINPHLSTLSDLQACARSNNVSFPVEQGDDKDTWLHLLLSHCIEPYIGKQRPVFVMDFPASQCALAKLSDDLPTVAERFEVYYQGRELANGYHELTDPIEQARRFKADNEMRIRMGLPEIPLDKAFLQALQQGMPECAGVAMGVDRLVMMALGAASLKEVVFQ